MKTYFLAMSFVLMSASAFAGGETIGNVACSLQTVSSMAAKTAPLVKTESMGSYFISSRLSLSADDLAMDVVVENDTINVTIKKSSGEQILMLNSNESVEMWLDALDINIGCYIQKNEQE